VSVRFALCYPLRVGRLASSPPPPKSARQQNIQLYLGARRMSKIGLSYPNCNSFACAL
jgi:hypothetical protein